jgi:hypothetical protein
MSISDEAVNPETAEALRQWVRSMGRMPSCPMCGHPNFAVAQFLVELPLVRITAPGRTHTEGASLVCYSASCEKCGFVYLFSKKKVDGEM